MRHLLWKLTHYQSVKRLHCMAHNALYAATYLRSDVDG